MDLNAALACLSGQLRNSVPRDEAELRDGLADCLRANGGETVTVERPHGQKLVDVWVGERTWAAEVKYHRGAAGGRPLTQEYGQLLADVAKLQRMSEPRQRLLVLLTDQAGDVHLRNKELLPVNEPTARRITSQDVGALAAYARGPAIAESAWSSVDVQVVWDEALAGELHGYAWTVEPAGPPEGHGRP